MFFTIELILFFLFSMFSILSATFVVLLNNAVQAVLFLVLTFFNVACLLLLLGAEFFSFLLIIVYVGAIAVLFLFVIMMLNLKLHSKEPQWTIHFPIILITFVLVSLQFNSILDQTDLLRFCTAADSLTWTSWLENKDATTNIFVIGNVLYSVYGLLFLLASLVLLIAMIGAIVLTMHYKLSQKAQIINLQVIRNPKDSVKFIKLRI